MKKVPLIVAHGGDREHAPEQTIAAYEHAIHQGADAIECDVHLTRDGELVIHHDYYLGRTDTGKGYIGDFTLAELQSLDAGSWFHQDFSGERIPTLRDVLVCGKGHVRFEIEIRTPTDDCIRNVLETITQLGLEEMVEITSPHLPVLSRMTTLKAPCRLGVFFAPYPDWMHPELAWHHIESWMTLSQAHVAHIPAELLDVPYINALQHKGFLVHGANLNTEKTIQQGIEAGVDQFSTDTLATAVNIRKKHIM